MQATSVDLLDMANSPAVTREYLLNCMHLPKVELDKFDGNPLEYLTFIAVFDEVVDNTVMDGQVKLTRLLQYTCGSAKAALCTHSAYAGDFLLPTNILVAFTVKLHEAGDGRQAQFDWIQSLYAIPAIMTYWEQLRLSNFSEQDMVFDCIDTTPEANAFDSIDTTPEANAFDCIDTTPAANAFDSIDTTPAANAFDCIDTTPAASAFDCIDTTLALHMPFGWQMSFTLQMSSCPHEWRDGEGQLNKILSRVLSDNLSKLHKIVFALLDNICYSWCNLLFGITQISQPNLLGKIYIVTLWIQMIGR